MQDGITAALVALGEAAGVNRSILVYGAISAAHVLGIALLVGPILLVNLRLAGLLAGLDARAVLILRRAAAAGVVLSVVTGVLLLSTRPAEYFANPVMLVKLGLVALGIAHALAFEWRYRQRSVARAPVAAAVSGLIWLSALALGRAIAFTGD